MAKATVKKTVKANGSKFFYGTEYDLQTEKDFNDSIKFGDYNQGDRINKYQLMGTFEVSLDPKLIPTKSK